VAAVWRIQDPWPIARCMTLLDKHPHTSLESLYLLHLASKVGFEDVFAMTCNMDGRAAVPHAISLLSRIFWGSSRSVVSGNACWDN